MATIIFATIGDPTGYKVVEYFIQNKKPVSSKVSYLALKELLCQDTSQPQDIKTVAIIGISTADSFKRISTTGNLGCNCDDYNSCSKCIIDKAKEFDVRADEFIVAPNMYKNFKSKPDYYFTYVYYSTLKILENEENLTGVYLDITHGVNYMVDLAKEALLLATSAYASGKEKSVTFKVYNSDPLFRDETGQTSKGPYEIREIEKRTINPLLGLKHVTTQILSRISVDSNYFQNLRKDKVINDITKITKSTNALDNGLFVYFADKSSEIQKIMESLESKMDIDMEKCSDSQKCDDEIRIEFKPGSYALLHSLLYIALRFKAKGNCLDINMLKEFAEKYADKVTRTIIENEIDISIEKHKDKIGKEKKLLREITKGEKIERGSQRVGEKEGEGKSAEKRGFEKRILYAHGGLPEAGTYVYEQDGKICVTYGDKIDEIENQL